jgi:AcrR family transcriptional regulator
MDNEAQGSLRDSEAWLDPPEVDGLAATSVAGERLYGGLTGSERRAMRRDRLLDAGLELFATTGYAGTTIEAICVSAAVTPRHFYEEFGSRQQLLAAVFDRAVDTTMMENFDHRTRTVTVPEDFEAMLRNRVSRFIHAFLDDPRRARVVCIESVGVNAAMEAHRRKHFHRFSLLLQSDAELLADRPDARRELVLTTRALVGGTSELIVDWLMDEDPAPLDVLSKVLSDLYLAVFAYR